MSSSGEDAAVAPETPTGKDASMLAGAPPGEVASKRSVVAALVLLALVLVVAGIAYGALAGTPASEPSAASGATPAGGQSGASAGQTAQEVFYLVDYDCTVYVDEGEATTLTEIAGGKPMVINFWATWCPYCIQEMADFQGIYDDYQDKVAFAFIDATDGVRETVADARAYIDEQGFTIPVYYDIDRAAVRSFAVSSYPTTIVVAADGEILGYGPGKIDPARMRSALDSLV